MNYKKEIKRLLSEPFLKGYKMSFHTKLQLFLFALKTPFRNLKLLPEILKGKMEWVVIRELLVLPIYWSLCYFYYLPNRYYSAKAGYLLTIKKYMSTEIKIVELRYPKWWEFEK